MTQTEAAVLIRNSAGRIFAVEFVKRSDGSLRRGTFRLGVTSHLKGGDAAYNFREQNLISVFDMDKRAYRSIPIEGIVRLSLGGAGWVEVTNG